MTLICRPVLKSQEQIQLPASQMELLLHHQLSKIKEKIRLKQLKLFKSKILKNRAQPHLIRQTLSYQNLLTKNGALNHQDPLRQKRDDDLNNLI